MPCITYLHSCTYCRPTACGTAHRKETSAMMINALYSYHCWVGAGGPLYQVYPKIEKNCFAMLLSFHFLYLIIRVCASVAVRCQPASLSHLPFPSVCPCFTVWQCRYMVVGGSVLYVQCMWYTVQASLTVCAIQTKYLLCLPAGTIDPALGNPFSISVGQPPVLIIALDQQVKRATLP